MNITQAMQDVLNKHDFVKLSSKEAKQSRANYQHRSMHEMGERYALTINVDGENWCSYDHRGDKYQEGNGADTLDKCLTSLGLDDE